MNYPARLVCICYCPCLNPQFWIFRRRNRQSRCIIIRLKFFCALVVSIIATVLKICDRSHMGAVLLATSLVADFQLIAAAIVWGYASQVTGVVSPSVMASVVSLAGGAMLANLTSVVLLLAETIQLKR
jgi:hypothetical protein